MLGELIEDLSIQLVLGFQTKTV